VVPWKETVGLIPHTFGTKKPSTGKKVIASFATYRSHATCPPSCAFYRICYGYEGNVKYHAERAATSSLDLERYICELPLNAQLRHLVVGDLALHGVDVNYLQEALAGHHQRPDVMGILYSHLWPYLDPTLNEETPNLTVNASCETDYDILDALNCGWPVVRVVPRSYPDRRNRGTWRELVCRHEIDGSPCIACRMCLSRPPDVVMCFRAHGSGAAKIEQRLSELANAEGVAA
jgi:ferredoxin